MNVLTNYNAKSKVKFTTKESLAFSNRNICRAEVFLEMKLFSLLSLTTMTLQMTDGYLAVCWPVLYKAKKSKLKLLVVIEVKWIIKCFTNSICVFSALQNRFRQCSSRYLIHVAILELYLYFSCDSFSVVAFFYLCHFVFHMFYLHRAKMETRQWQEFDLRLAPYTQSLLWLSCVSDLMCRWEYKASLDSRLKSS